MLILILPLASCATMDGHAEHCAGWKPITVSQKDVLTDGTAKQILAHDRYGVASGCWPKPHEPKKA